VNLAGQSQPAIGRAIRWLAGMQSKNGELGR
jgi:hypothetical protein